jgi:AcrR family transcriptional regulator
VKVTASTDRREAIGDAAITIVAREGLRSLTHRAVDRELGLPAGSTSYYTRTRRELVELMVHRLADRTVGDMRTASAADEPRPTVAKTARGLAALIDQLAARADDHRARYALTVDLVGDSELHAYITNASPVRAATLAAATDRLGRLGVLRPERHAPGLVALIDGLLFDRVAGSGLDPASRPDAETVIRAYIRGLTTY